LKKYLGQIIFNCFIAAGGLGLFTTTVILDSTLLTVAAIVGLMTTISVGNILFVKKINTGKSAFQPDYILTEQTFDSLVDSQDYIEVIKDLRNYQHCRVEARKLLQQWELFQKKSATLKAISYSGGVYDVVDQNVESVMLSNMLLFMKRAAIMQSSTNNEETMMHKNYLQTLLKSNDKILKDYTNLLIEASQLTGEDSGKAEVQSLNLLIQSIRDYRKELESGDMQ
jgi:hypothetical protein